MIMRFVLLTRQGCTVAGLSAAQGAGRSVCKFDDSEDGIVDHVLVVGIHTFRHLRCAVVVLDLFGAHYFH